MVNAEYSRAKEIMKQGNIYLQMSIIPEDDEVIRGFLPLMGPPISFFTYVNLNIVLKEHKDKVDIPAVKMKQISIKTSLFSDLVHDYYKIDYNVNIEAVEEKIRSLIEDLIVIGLEFGIINTAAIIDPYKKDATCPSAYPGQRDINYSPLLIHPIEGFADTREYVEKIADAYMETLANSRLELLHIKTEKKNDADKYKRYRQVQIMPFRGLWPGMKDFSYAPVGESKFMEIYGNTLAYTKAYNDYVIEEFERKQDNEEYRHRHDWDYNTL